MKRKIRFSLVYRDILQSSVNTGERICYIRTNLYLDQITSPYEGEVVEIVVSQGTNVNKGDVLFKIKEQKRKKSKKIPV
jgi:pyruvate/2-oxoglutarate dehydrogenase complex dihydrolipoamide acyltransferase (E2) component